MNKGKEGKPFEFTNSYVRFLDIVRYLYGFPYRQLEGFTRILEKFASLPSGDYSALRWGIVKVDTAPFSTHAGSNEPLSIALDSTGIRVLKAGGWIEREHGVRKRYLKLHIAVDVKTKEVVGMEVTTDDVHDSKEGEKLLDQAGLKGKVKEMLGDGAYDTADIYELLKKKGIDAIIKPRKNSVLNTRSEARRQEVDLYRNRGHRIWVEIKGYGRRWAVETAYSTFKRMFGDSVMAKTMVDAVKELVAKVSIYNMLIRM